MPYLTPEELPATTVCRRLFVPDDPLYLAAFNGALLELSHPYNWEQFGLVTPEEAAYKALTTWITYVDDEAPCGLADDTSPFWDDPDAGDAEGSPAVSTYSFTDQIEDWAIAAFVAASGVPGAAITYLTIAPRFRLAFRTGDWGGIAKIFLDGSLYAEVDTYSALPGLKEIDVFVP